MSPHMKNLATRIWSTFRELGVILLKIGLAWGVVLGLGLVLLAPLLGWGPFAGPPSLGSYTLAGFSIGERAFRCLYGAMLVLSVAGFFLTGLTAALTGFGGTEEVRWAPPPDDPVLSALLACVTAIIASYVVALITLT